MEIDDVDRYHPKAVCQKRAAFAKPFNGCGMGYFRALATCPIDAGRPPRWSYRDIVEALFYLLRGELPWRMLPPDLFPPMTTVQHYFYEWRDRGLWSSINHTLLMMVREAVGRDQSQ